MAVMTLTPDGIAVSGWVANTGTVDGALAVNNGDTAYAEAGADGETCTLRFTNPGVAEGNISSITSVQILTYGRYPARGSGGEDVDFQYEVGAGTLSTETLNYPNSAFHNARNGAVQTSPPAGGAWSYSNLEDVEIKMTKNGASSTDVRVGMLNLLVTYVEAAVGYGNAVLGVASGDIGSINGIATANISKVNGV